jgi:transcriptional regulator with XRE-family HTH domain
MNAVKEVRVAARIPETRVAAAVGFSQPRVHHYLHGARTPDAEAVHKINAGLASLIGLPSLSRYLYSEYCLDLTGEGSGPRMDFAVVLCALDLVEPYLRDDYRPGFTEGFLTLHKSQRLRLVAMLNNVFFKRLIRRLLGRPEPHKRLVDEVLEASRRNGIDLTRWSRPDDELAVIKREDEFVRVVLGALTRRIPDPMDRFDAEREILDGLQEYTGTSLRGEGRAIAPVTP